MTTKTMQVTLSNAKQVAAAVARREGVRVRVVGHKLTTDWSGVGNTYGKGTCECGWRYPGWCEGLSAVRHSHQNHLTNVLRKA